MTFSQTYCQPATWMSFGYQVPALCPRKNRGATIIGDGAGLSQAAHHEKVLLAIIMCAHEDIMRKSIPGSPVRET